MARTLAAVVVLGAGLSGAPQPAQAQPVVEKHYGVNLAGAEWNETKLPGKQGVDYVYSNEPKRYRYYESKGFTLVRIPFRWERLQARAKGPLSAADVAGLRTMLNQARNHGQKAILVVQNFGRYYDRPLEDADASSFADLWYRLSAEFKDHEGLFGYELMNEPHDLPGGTGSWARLAQAATNAIRSEDQVHWVLVPGYHWQTAATWRSHNEHLNVTDRTGRLLYAAHQYFDADHSGRYRRSYTADGASPNTGADRLKPFTDWLDDQGFMGIVTEYGVPGDAPWLTVLGRFMDAVEAHPRLAGGTAWAAGPLWEGSFPAGYPLLLDPLWSASGEVSREKPQMQVLARTGQRPAATATPTPAPPSATPAPATATATSTPTATPATPSAPVAVPSTPTVTVTSTPTAAPPSPPASPPSTPAVTVTASATSSPTPGVPAPPSTTPNGPGPAAPPVAPGSPPNPAGTTPAAPVATAPVPNPPPPGPATIGERPLLAAPPDHDIVLDSAPALRWTNPAGTTQVHVQVLPFNNDGPGVNLILGPESAFRMARPELGVGNYLLLPDLTYIWRVRTTESTTALAETDGGWSPWAERRFRTPGASPEGISAAGPADATIAKGLTPTLEWTNSDTRVFYYEVQLSRDPTFNTDPRTATAAVYWELRHGGATVPLNSYQVSAATPLAPGTAYYWRVRPRIQGDGTPTPWSKTFSFKTP